MNASKNLSELEAGLPQIRQSPRDEGTVEFIVCRPAVGERKAIAEGEITLEHGLVGDSWLDRARGSRHGADAEREMQLTLMNSRAIALIAGDQQNWAPAGDQFYVDLDLSQDNLPPGSRLEIGTAIVEVSAEPHTGCKLFAKRYGTDAVKFVNSPEGKRLRLRGLNAKVTRPGAVRLGDAVRKI